MSPVKSLAKPTLSACCVAAMVTPTMPARERRLHFFGVPEHMSDHTSKSTPSRPVQTIVFVLNSSNMPREGGLERA